MMDLHREEYAALRATIRERGTVRVITFLATLVAWAALLLWLNTSGPRDVLGTLVTLMVLVAGFEAVYQIHVGVERVGRYLQVFHEAAPSNAAPAHGAAEDEVEPSDGRLWETIAVAYAQTYGGTGSDALFSYVFLIAAFINLLPVLRAWSVPPVVALVAAAHILFVLRVRIATHQASVQRAKDLRRFQDLRGGT